LPEIFYERELSDSSSSTPCSLDARLSFLVRVEESGDPRPVIFFVHAYITKWAQERSMQTHRFGRKIRLPATIAIKHQLRVQMAQDELKKAEIDAEEALRGRPREELPAE
jgi:hypothetical protein